MEIYATGLGVTGPATGGLLTTAVQPVVRIGGIVAEVLYSGLAPGFNGLYQINARIPSAASPGTQQLVVLSGEQPSNTVQLVVQ